MSERKYFPINEEMAGTAKHMMSFSDYEEGSATNEYTACVDKAYNLAKRIEAERPRQAERAWRIATTYARRMADNMNKQSRIGCMCPSILIAGGSNFPVRKKEKQIAAMDRAMEEWREIEGYITRLNNILYGNEVIRANDEDAILRLEEKLSEREASQELMKEVNAYYRKHKKLDGCPELTANQIEKMKANMQSSYRQDPKPFESYQLTNNNAEIRRLKKRIEDLKAIKESDDTEKRYDDLNLTVKFNTEAVRIQLFFDDKPDEDVRTIVKRHGFHWARSISCWQRQITNNARYSLERMIGELKQM